MTLLNNLWYPIIGIGLTVGFGFDYPIVANITIGLLWVSTTIFIILYANLLKNHYNKPEFAVIAKVFQDADKHRITKIMVLVIELTILYSLYHFECYNTMILYSIYFLVWQATYIMAINYDLSNTIVIDGQIAKEVMNLIKDKTKVDKNDEPK